jgi:hypothetical protein
MESKGPLINILVIALIVAAGLLPIVLFWLYIGDVPTVDSEEARNSSLLEQWSTVMAAFVVKPFYMLVSFGLIVIIWRLKSLDMVALKWALIFFLSGEIFCAINYIFFTEKSHLMEYLHIYGMVLCFGSVTYAFIEGVDLRIIRYSDPKKQCRLLELCETCVKYTDTHCEIRRVFLFMIPLVFTLCFMPILSDLHGVSYNTVILGTHYNYSHSAIYQIFEIHIAPVIGALLFAASFMILLVRKEHQVRLPKLLFAGGVGFFGFSMFRLVIFKIYRDNLVWFVVSEEVTELLFILWIGAILWIFRGKIFQGGDLDEFKGIG